MLREQRLTSTSLRPEVDSGAAPPRIIGDAKPIRSAGAKLIKSDLPKGVAFQRPSESYAD
jgi:hypothetical protein